VLVASLVGRLPTGMFPLAVVLLTRADGGSYARAGLLALAYSLGAAVAGPPVARAVDRLGQSAVLWATAWVSVAAACGLGVVGAGGPLAVALAVLAGAATPPLEPCLRALWPGMLADDGLTQTAYALDAAVQELVFVTGPLVVVLAVALAGAPAGPVGAGLLGLAGTAAFATSRHSRAWRGQARAPDWAGPLRGGGVRVVLLVMVLVGIALGGTEVAFPAFAEAAGQLSLAGWLLAAQAAGSMAGGLAYGAVSWRGTAHRRLAPLLALLCAGYLPLPLTPGPAGMLALAFLAGVMLAPALACAFVVLDAEAPSGTVTEAFAWLVTAILLGASAGSGIAGALISASGLEAGLATSAAAALAATAAALPLARRRSDR
jgi:predicted MFS family arabinose efflux permease